jgi:hypothetical protein
VDLCGICVKQFLIAVIAVKNSDKHAVSKANKDGLVKSQKMASPVIPAKAGIQEKQALLDPGFRRGDGFDDFLRSRQ